MKRILILSTLLIILVSCKTTYVYKGTEDIVIDNTIVIPQCHHHYGDTNCIYIESWSFDYTDTLVIEVWKKRKTFK